MSDMVRKTVADDSQRLMDTNEVGFYTSARMGLCFRLDILTELINVTKKFKNSVMIIYDTQKSNYGLNPLKAYRLSEKAISTFKLSTGSVNTHFV
jgi:hypothetical protein